MAGGGARHDLQPAAAGQCLRQLIGGDVAQWGEGRIPREVFEPRDDDAPRVERRSALSQQHDAGHAEGYDRGAAEQRRLPAHPRQPQTRDQPATHRFPEAGCELVYGRETVVGLCRQRAGDGLLDDPLAAVAYALCTQHRVEGRAAARRSAGESQEWRLAHQHLIQHAPQAVHIGARIDSAAPHQLLGAHISQRPYGVAPGERVAAGGADRARDTEVGHPGVISGQEDVFGLDVAMDDAVRVCVGQRIADLEGDAQRFLEWQALLPLQAGPQGLALDVRHHVVAQPVGPIRHEEAFVRGENRHDVRVAEPGRELDFPDEALAKLGARDLGVHHLHRHLAWRMAFGGEEHARHAPGPDLPFDGVMGRKALAQGS